MKPIKIEEVVWVENLGIDHTKKAMDLLNRKFNLMCHGSPPIVELRELNLEYETTKEPGVDWRLGQLIRTGRVKITGTFY
jgi:hypothetical protein